MSTLEKLTVKLADANYEGYSFNCLPIPGEQEVLQIIVSEQEELPIYLTITDKQILCITYLFDEDEVRSDKLAELNEVILKLNVPMPLSAFAKVDEHYALFGALATTSSFDDIQQELITLSTNSVAALEAIEEYLI